MIVSYFSNYLIFLNYFELLVLMILGFSNDLSPWIPNGSSSSLRIRFLLYSRILICFSVGFLSNLLFTFCYFYFDVTVVLGLCWLMSFEELTAEKFRFSVASSDMIPKSADKQFGPLICLVLPVIKFYDCYFFYIYRKEILPLGTATPMPLFFRSFGWDST